MQRKQLLASVVAIGTFPALASAVLVESLDFTNGGAAWTVNTVDGGLPLVFELGGDPTNVGIPNPAPATGTGQYRLLRQVFAPAGFEMSNIRLEGKASGYSSWVMEGRVGFDIDPNDLPLTNDYSFSAAQAPNGSNNDDVPFVLDSSSNPAYQNLTSIYVSVEIVKGLSGVWEDNNVRELKVYADLTPIPEPSFALIVIGAGTLLARRRRGVRA